MSSWSDCCGACLLKSWLREPWSAQGRESDVGMRGVEMMICAGDGL